MDSCVLTDTLTQFVEDEREFISKQGQGDPLIVIGKLEQIYQYYKGMETSCTEKLSKYLLKIANNQSSLDTISKFLDDNFDETYFALSDQVFAMSKINNNKKVLLWLGANTMLEYDYDEAIIVLTDNIKEAKALTKKLEKELDIIKSKLTTVEVNLARVHNFHIRNKKSASS